MKLLVYGYGILIYLVLLVYFLRVWSWICGSFRFLKLFLESLYVLFKCFVNSDLNNFFIYFIL